MSTRSTLRNSKKLTQDVDFVAERQNTTADQIKGTIRAKIFFARKLRDVSLRIFGSFLTVSSIFMLTLALQYSAVASAATPTGTAYYVRTDGNDSSDGLSDATAWRTVAKVNSTVKTTGADVYFKAGNIWKGEALIVDWSGTSADRVTIGTYYMSGATPVVLEPDNISAAAKDYNYSKGTRAEIRGTYSTRDYLSPATCSGQLSCVHDTSDAVPSSQYSALVTVKGDYVTVQDLRLIDSAGMGLSIPRIEYQQAGRKQTILRRNYIDRTYTGAIFIEDAQNFLVSGNVHDNGGLREFEGVERSNPWSIGIRRDGSTTLALYGVVENNEIRRMNGEGINYIAPYLIVRGNRIGNMGARPCIYAHTGNTVIEYNICYGGQVDGTPAVAGAGIKVFVEDFDRNIHVPIVDFVVRGNMVSGTGTGIAVGAENLSIADGLQFGGYIYNNTVIQSNTAVDLHWLTAANFAPSGVLMRNNIFYANTTQCGSPASTGGRFIADHNLWFSAPKDVCSGMGDLIANPLVTGSGFAQKVYTAPPVPSDFMLGKTSPARGVGTPLTSTIGDVVLHTQSAAITFPCATFDTAGSTIDAACAPRNAKAPAMGAMENDGSPTAFELTVD